MKLKSTLLSTVFVIGGALSSLSLFVNSAHAEMFINNNLKQTIDANIFRLTDTTFANLTSEQLNEMIEKTKQEIDASKKKIAEGNLSQDDLAQTKQSLQDLRILRLTLNREEITRSMAAFHANPATQDVLFKSVGRAIDKLKVDQKILDTFKLLHIKFLKINKKILNEDFDIFNEFHGEKYDR